MNRRFREWGQVLLPGLRLKRWLLVVFLGLFQLGVGARLWLGGWLRGVRGNPLVQLLTLSPLPRGVRGLAFVASGGLFTYLGWQRLSQTLVRVMLPEQPDAQLGQVLLQRQRVERGRRVVVIGADPGLTPTVAALQNLAPSIRLDVILSATEQGYRAQELQGRFGLTGQQVHFPTADDATLYAELEDGRLLEGASTINRFSGGRITNLFLSRDIRRVQVWEAGQNGRSTVEQLRDYMPNVSEAALEAVQQAEMIVFAPGRLHTHILPNLVLPRFAQAVQESKATKVLVANLMTEPGHTEGWTVADHLGTIRALSGVTLDYALVHQGDISAPMLRQYHNEGADVVRLKPDEVGSRLIFANTGEETSLVEGAVLIQGNFVTEAPQIVTFQRGEETILREMPVVRHDPQKVGPVLGQLLAEKL